jgi:hypothetical protein
MDKLHSHEKYYTQLFEMLESHAGDKFKYFCGLLNAERYMGYKTGFNDCSDNVTTPAMDEFLNNYMKRDT